MKDSVIYVGIDVHKDTNSVCMYDRQDNAFFAEAKLDTGTDIMVRYLEKAVKDYGLSGEFLLGYEAGPTGYGLLQRIEETWLQLRNHDPYYNKEVFRGQGEDRQEGRQTAFSNACQRRIQESISSGSIR